MTTAASSKWPRNALLALQGLQILSLGPWVIVGGLSFMVFDAPGSTENTLLWAFVAAVWSYPLWLLMAGAVSWWLLLRLRPVGALVLGAIFSLPALALVLWIVGISLIARWN